MLPIIILYLAFAKTAIASPEVIKPGTLYYADEYEIKDNIAHLGAEKNYEEVFKNYNYYEAAYDDQKRLILFRAYKNGEIEWEERYSYHPNGRGLASRKTTRSGKPEHLDKFPPMENKEEIK
ncbi:MAG: hypothetical protein IMF07_08325 [Proteobacteria bacterium]|nr:hypothetical protein [Pseudomonadota bacterium]